jgi:hypothetical protein
VRGSRLPLPPGGTLRFFLWCKEGDIDGQPTGRVDIDLSAVLFGDAFDYREHISWTSLRSAKFRGAHSGDITSAPEGACEFIDLELDSVLAHGGRYLVASAMSYTGQTFARLPECFMGWMMRASPASGEIFEPRTVVERVDLAADQRIAIPAVFDLVTREVIWTDIGYAHPIGITMVETTRTSQTQLARAMVALRRTTLQRLFTLHAEARGTLVPTETEADTVFGIERGTTPFDHEVIIARYLA